jgi:SIT4-associating protein SAP185/190
MHLVKNANKNKELKVASGDRIEPLGFDRFKTCELMAELLHCSNMALLNERGSEAEVQKRDAERERLKAEGKLQPAKELSSDDADAFGTSVDSSGFHHARAPSLSSDSPEEIKRLEVSNGGEDEYEKVSASEALVDEMKDELLDEKEAFAPLERSPKQSPRMVPTEKSDDADLVVPPLSPKKPAVHGRTRSTDNVRAEAQAKVNADSPTSAGVTGLLDSVNLDKDTEMPDSPSTIVEKGGLSPQEADKPAPLFAGKRSASPDKPSEAQDSTRAAAADQTELADQPPSDDGENAQDQTESPFEVDTDGSPVVGDVLKMQFVEHHVVPTILVSLPLLLRSVKPHKLNLGLLFPFSMEQFPP